MQADAHRTAARIAQLDRAQRATLLRRLAQQGMDASALPIVPVRRDEPLPLSHAQRGLWLTWRLAPQSAAYNMAGTLALDGPLDRRALSEAVDELARRHEVLRTVFRQGPDGEPEQVVGEGTAGTLQVEDLCGLPPAAREAQALARSRRHAELPFDLQAGPVWRALLLRLDERTHWLSIVAHHIVADGWSVPVLIEDLSALYEARV